MYNMYIIFCLFVYSKNILTLPLVTETSICCEIQGLPRLPSVLYSKSPCDPHKNFLGQKSRALNPEIFLLRIQFKIVLMYSVRVISQIISQILLFE